MVRVSQESRDTQTRGVEAEELYPSRDCPGMVRVSQESRDTQTRGGRGRRAVSIPGLSWDGQSIPGIPGYSDKGGVEAGELYPSRDCPGMVRVSQESRDTQTRGVIRVSQECQYTVMKAWY